jgi:hypothetical protein
VRKLLVGHGLCRYFHKAKTPATDFAQVARLKNPLKNRRFGWVWRKYVATGCTKNRHPPVRELHSIEMQADKVARILLTLKMKGVET